MHHALKQQDPVIWFAKDHAGMGRKECDRLTQSIGKYGVEVTDHGAVMKGEDKLESVDASVTDTPWWKRKIVYQFTY